MEGDALAQRVYGGADLHGREHNRNIHECPDEPAKVALEEDLVAVIAVEIAADEVRAEETQAEDGVDAAQPELAEVVPLVDLVEGVEVDVPVEVLDKLLPPRPGDLGRDEMGVLGQLQVDGRAYQPDPGEQEAARQLVQRLVLAQVFLPEVVVEDVVRQRLEVDLVREMDEMQVCLLRGQEFEADHLVPLHLARVQRPPGHPEQAMDIVEPLDAQVARHEPVDALVLDQIHRVAAVSRLVFGIWLLDAGNGRQRADGIKLDAQPAGRRWASLRLPVVRRIESCIDARLPVERRERRFQRHTGGVCRLAG